MPSLRSRTWLELSGEIGGSSGPVKLKGSRTVWFEDGPQETPIYRRYGLSAGDRINGPAIIEEREATTVIGPSDALEIDDGLNLRIKIGQRSSPARLVTPDISRHEAIDRLKSDPVGLEIMWSRLVELTQIGQRVCLTVAGGAGYGAPASRDPEAVRSDLELGYVTASKSAMS